MRPRTIRSIVSVDDTITWMDIAAWVLITVLFLTTVWAVIQAGQRYQEYEMIEVVVQPGDTLWGLATTHYPGRDPREVVYIIREANGGLDPGAIRPGDVVLVPVEGR